MSRYVVMPTVGLRGALYYIVTDSATGKGVEGYGCETWANHRADALNRKNEGETNERRYHTTSL